MFMLVAIFCYQRSVAGDSIAAAGHEYAAIDSIVCRLC